MLTVLTQKPTFLLGNWDKSYWRGSLLTELSAPIEVVARFSELNRIVLWEKRFAGWNLPTTLQPVRISGSGPAQECSRS